MKQIKNLSEEFLKKGNVNDDLNNWIEGSITYPTPIIYAGTNRTVNDETTLLAAITASNLGDIITLTADITLTVQLVINKSIKIDGAFILQSASDGTAPVALINVTANDVYITSAVTIKHRKTTNTSVEVAVIGNGERFISNATVEFMEFGYQLFKSFAIGGATTYTGALGNSHRHIAIYNITNPSIVNGVTYSSPQEATVRASFVYVSSATGSEVNSNLKVSNNFPLVKTNTIRQFFLQDAFITSGNPSLIFENNYFNDVNGGIGLYDGAGTISPLDFFDYIAIIANRQGDAGSASYKGMLYVDGVGTGVAIGNTNFYSISNVTAITTLRASNTALFAGEVVASYTTTAFTNLVPLTKMTNVKVQNSIYNYVQGVTVVSPILKTSKFTVTTGTNATNSNLTLATGTLTNGGASTQTGNIITCADSTTFNKGTFSIDINGLIQVKGSDVTFSSSGVLTIALQLEVGDIITVKDYI